MGHGTYNFTTRSDRAMSANYDSVTASTLDTVFEQKKKRKIHATLSPKGVGIRESRDSGEHPNSFAVIIALDVTGSMGAIPAKLIKDGIPHIIQRLFEAGIHDPQVAFVAIGDHETDRYPLQIGQFESSDELLDQSLVKVYPEGGGGGNDGESYHLAWYHAAYHTSIDCLEKRGMKGVLVTIGDEACLPTLPGNVVTNLYGGQPHGKDYTAEELLAAAQEKYHVFHINVAETRQGHVTNTYGLWDKLMTSNYISVQSHEDVPATIAQIVTDAHGEPTSPPEVTEDNDQHLL